MSEAEKILKKLNGFYYDAKNDERRIMKDQILILAETEAFIRRLSAENAELRERDKDNGDMLIIAYLDGASAARALADKLRKDNERLTKENAAQAERIAKLEDALANVRTAIETADPEVLVCTLWMPDKWPNETVVDHIDNALARAALGGE